MHLAHATHAVIQNSSPFMRSYCQHCLVRSVLRTYGAHMSRLRVVNSTYFGWFSARAKMRQRMKQTQNVRFWTSRGRILERDVIGARKVHFDVNHKDYIINFEKIIRLKCCVYIIFSKPGKCSCSLENIVHRSSTLWN